jgi:hypothetical protein
LATVVFFADGDDGVTELMAEDSGTIVRGCSHDAESD